MAKKILVVDDEPNIVKLIANRLKANNYDVVTACDGQETLELVQKEKPDLVILDLMLPKLNGYKVCSVLKSNEEYKSTPIVMLTARTEARDIKEGLQVGGEAYITKPFKSDLLLGIVQGLLGA